MDENKNTSEINAEQLPVPEPVKPVEVSAQQPAQPDPAAPPADPAAPAPAQ